MATLNQIAERVAYQLGDPTNIMLRENVKFSFLTWRSTLIRRDIAANGMSDGFLQRFTIPLIKVDKADNCNFNLDCVQILRSATTIPKPVRLKTDSIFKFVGTVDGKPMSQVEYEEVPYTCYNQYTSKALRFCYINDYLYIFNNTKLKFLMLQYIVEDPRQINNSCTTDSCYSDDKEFPAPLDLVNQAILAMLAGDLKILTNNAPADSEVQVSSDTKQ